MLTRSARLSDRMYSTVASISFQSDAMVVAALEKVGAQGAAMRIGTNRLC